MLCLHLDRFFFDGLTSQMQEYVRVSMIVHAGDANAGHYRALL